MSDELREKRKASTAITDRVYEQLQSMLVDGIIQPGERISVDGISRRLGVSQTPVRVSLSRLEAEDLVTKTHLIGYSATPKLTLSRFEDLFEARLLIEPYCAGLAAVRHQRSQIEQIVEISTEMRHGYESGRMSYGAFAKRDAELHEAIIDATGNSYYRELFTMLHCHLQLFRLLRDSRVTSDALDEHEQLIVAISRRSTEASEAAMNAHLLASRGRLRTAFSGPGSEPATGPASGPTPAPDDPIPAQDERIPAHDEPIEENVSRLITATTPSESPRPAPRRRRP